jgi:hypothetical protein
MKKVSILLLLTVVLASFTFAIEGVGDFTAGLEVNLDNVSGANEGALSIDPFEVYFTYARSFGAFGLSATLGNYLHVPTDKDKNGTDEIGDDLYFNVTPSYTLAAGPGELGFALSLQLNVPLTDKGYGLFSMEGTSVSSPYLDKDRKLKSLFFRVDPSISYGLDAGFGALAFELGTDHLQISTAGGDPAKRDEYGLENLPIYFQAGVDLSFGLGLWVKPYFVIDTTDDNADADVFNQFVFDIHYAINEQITAGVETTIPTFEDGIKTAGVEVIPYGKFSFGPIAAYVKVDLTLIGAETTPIPPATDTKAKDIAITPIIGVSYSF